MMNHGAHAPGSMYHGGRRSHEMPYTPQAQYPPNMYQYHPQHVPPSYHHQPPQQWAYYNMQSPMPRPYQQPPYPPMMAPPYHMAQTSMSPRPHPPQHIPSSSSFRPHHHLPSPPPTAIDRSEQSHKPPVSTNQMIPSPAPSIAPHPLPPSQRAPFQPPLPWYSVPEEEFPKSRARRRRTIAPQSQNARVELPTREKDVDVQDLGQESQIESTDISTEQQQAVHASPIAQPHETRAPSTPAAFLENEAIESGGDSAPKQNVLESDSVRQSRKVVPAIPAIPSISKSPRTTKRASGSIVSEAQRQSETASNTMNENIAEMPMAGEESQVSNLDTSSATPQQKSTPKSWADLVRRKASVSATGPTTPSGSAREISSALLNPSGGSKADIFSSFSVTEHDANDKISFLKPRGLINTGNMCYMNSILQALAFCVPFYDFLEQVRKHAAYSFKTETPMVDAMIMFIREFPVIDSASSSEQLNLRLKDVELEDYGESFIPEFVYEAIRGLPRFSSMRRGHQQDAEEFLGFLLEEMHEECVQVMKGLPNADTENYSTDKQPVASDENGWLEVGPRQKAAITRSAGIVEAESPITKIFGGKLRSELRVPGAKNSVTLEPYQPLQLDIGSPEITNITEALKGLTRSEVLHGDFNSPRGPGMNATKQVFVETLPPVLILHLKRFQYDNAGGTQKIWKRVGYPLELEIPKELFPPHRRGSIMAHNGLPRYRLISVVYHHGKNASGGHYTVDMRRQNDREWIRLDDTVIRRVKSEDVAEAGGEEDPKLLATALEQHKHDSSLAHANMFDSMRDESGSTSILDKGWSQVNGGANHASKKWPGMVNGTETPTTTSGKRTPVGRHSIKDNKVAYILFYQKIET